MFLTHCMLNPDRRGTRDLVLSPQRLHAALLGCFVPGTSERGRILWRLDQPTRHQLDLYIVSPVEPSMESLIDQAGWPHQPVWRTASYNTFLNGLTAGQTWQFRLTANATTSVRDAGPRGRRISAVAAQRKREERDGIAPQDRLDRDTILRSWLEQQSKRHGFDLSVGPAGPRVKIVETGEQFRRRSDGQPRTVTLATASFDGVLVVSDAAQLRSALCGGIGPAKGYGCGLLTLAPLSTPSS